MTTLSSTIMSSPCPLPPTATKSGVIIQTQAIPQDELSPPASEPDLQADSAITEISPSAPWTFMNTTLTFPSPDASFWWSRTGRLFAHLLQRAGYTAADQYRELLFYALFVAPELGPAPDAAGNPVRWRSPGTPDFTPIDFSWEFGAGANAAKGTVRYSFEPIGPLAGTSADPLNRFATDRWIEKLRSQGLVPGLDLKWYEHFTRAVLPLEESERTEKTTGAFIEETTPKAGTVVALDLEKTGPVMKMYIYPGLKAKELGISNLDMVKWSIRSLPEYERLTGVEGLLEYLTEGTERWGFETGILGIDCLRPEDARIKIYVRAPHTTVEYLMDALTMGGRVPLGADSEEAIRDLKDFWNAFLRDAPAVLPTEAVGRASPGFYYTVGCGREVAPKVYLCPSYFCESDQDCLDRLRGYFETRTTYGSEQEKDDTLLQMDNYEGALQGIFDKKTLEGRCGSHYYIGCALHKNKLRVVTYLTPQTFDCERDRIAARLGSL